MVEYFKGVNKLLTDAELASDGGAELRLAAVQVLSEMKNKEWGLSADQRCSRVIERVVGLLVRIAAHDLNDNVDECNASTDELSESRLQCVEYFCEFMRRLSARGVTLAANFYASHVLQTVFEHVPLMYEVETSLREAVSDIKKNDTKENDTKESDEENVFVDGDNLRVDSCVVEFWEEFTSDGVETVWEASHHTCGTHVVRSLVAALGGRGSHLRHHLQLGRRMDASKKTHVESETVTAPICVPPCFIEILDNFAMASVDYIKEDVVENEFSLAHDPHTSPFLQELLKSLHTWKSQRMSQIMDAIFGFAEAKTVTSVENDEGLCDDKNDFQLFKIADQLAVSSSGSRLLEVAIEVCSDSEFDILFTCWASQRINFLSTMKLGNFVIQKFFSSHCLTETHLQQAIETIDTSLLLTSEMGKAVLSRVCEAAARIGMHGDKIVTRILRSLGVSRDYYRLSWLCLLTLQTEGDLDINIAKYSDNSSSNHLTVSRYGCAMLTAALRYNIKEASALLKGYKNFTQLPQPLLVELANNPSASRVLESVYDSAVSAKSTLRLSRCFLGRYCDLALHPISSFFVTTAFRHAPAHLARSISMELISKHDELKMKNRKLFQLCNLQEFKRNATGWEVGHTNRVKTKKLFYGILSSDKGQDGLDVARQQKRRKIGKKTKTQNDTNS